MLSIFSKTKRCTILIELSSHPSTFWLRCILQHEDLIDWAVKATTTETQHLGILTCIRFYREEKRGQKKRKKKEREELPWGPKHALQWFSNGSVWDLFVRASRMKRDAMSKPRHRGKQRHLFLLSPGWEQCCSFYCVHVSEHWKLNSVPH